MGEAALRTGRRFLGVEIDPDWVDASRKHLAAVEAEIAERMALSVKTVSTYRTRILEKMVMNNNAELTHYAIKNQLIE